MKNTDVKEPVKEKESSVYDLELPDDFVPNKISQRTDYSRLGGVKNSVKNSDEAIIGSRN